jgi:hypothetical protein
MRFAAFTQCVSLWPARLHNPPLHSFTFSQPLPARAFGSLSPGQRADPRRRCTPSCSLVVTSPPPPIGGPKGAPSPKPFALAPRTPPSAHIAGYARSPQVSALPISAAMRPAPRSLRECRRRCPWPVPRRPCLQHALHRCPRRSRSCLRPH